MLRLQGVELIDRSSLGALITLLSSELVVLSHSARDAYLTRRKRGRAVVNLWHGVAIKRIEAMMLPRGDMRTQGEYVAGILGVNDPDHDPLQGGEYERALDVGDVTVQSTLPDDLR